jgi:single-strand DNA-binding protein
MSLNKVMLIGNVGKDPNIRYLDGNSGGGAGNKVATFTLATTERYRDRSGETRENTEWHNIVAWRNSADIAEKFIHKGTQLYIEGKLRTRSYTDPNGVQKYTTEVVVDSLQLLSRRPDEEGGYQPRQQYGQPQYGQPAPPIPPQPAAPVQPAAPEAPAGFDADGSDDLPF